MSLSDWWHLARGEHGLLVLVGIVAAGWTASGGNAPFSFLLWAGIGPMLVTWASFILNDYFDLPSDKKLGRKERPLVSKAIAQSHARLSGWILLALGIGQSALVTPHAFVVCAVFGLAGVLYSMFLKRLPLVGHLFIGFSMAVPLLYGNWAVSRVLSFETVMFAASAFLIGFGRELLITLRDVKGDKEVGALTLPMMLGAKRTAWIASFFLLWGVGMAAALAPFRSTMVYVTGLLLAAFLVFLTVYRVLDSPTVANLKVARKWTLAALGLGLLSFVGLAF